MSLVFRPSSFILRRLRKSSKAPKVRLALFHKCLAAFLCLLRQVVEQRGIASKLLQAGRAKDAVVWFERALVRTPNRSRAVLGLARAAAKAGAAAKSRGAYKQFLANWRLADDTSAEVREAREVVVVLFEVEGADIATYAGMSISMVAVGLLASYMPARRASNVDPIESLRGE